MNKEIRRFLNFWGNLNSIKKEAAILIIVVLFSIPSFINLTHQGYFPMHDDMQVLRLYEMEKCMKDGQIPCRWSSDMAAGYGQPMFNFYSAFPYYLGVFFRIFGLAFIDIVKLLFILSLCLSGIFMYLFGKELFGRLGGLASALLFVYAPYHAVDVYVRGALSETWAITFLPLIFLGIYKFIKEEKFSWFTIFIVSLALFLLTHNISSLITLPFLILWTILLLVLIKKLYLVPKILLSYIWAFGLSAFFVLPMLFEKRYIAIELLTLEYYNYVLHFVTKGQLLFLRYWDYGPSLGANSRMSFQIGWPHWWLVLLVLPLLIWFLIKKIKTQETFISLFFLLMFFVSAFFTHVKSLFLWHLLPVLSIIQFPWRFLGIVIFAVSLIGGSLIFSLNLKLPRKFVFLLTIGLVFSVIFLNQSYFRPERFYPQMNDAAKLSGIEMEAQMRGALLDYLPKTVKEATNIIAPTNPWVVEGKADISEFSKRSDFWRFSIDVKDGKNAKVKVPVLDFPKWEVLIDQQKINFTNDNPEGVIELEIPEGRHTVVGWFEDTLVRKIANITTLISFSGLTLFLIYTGRKKDINA